MYTHYFRLEELPFSIAPDPHFMYLSPLHKEGLAHLLYGIRMGGGFVALTGEVGTGKTTLCHCLLQQLPENVDIALILNPKLNAIELLATICDELGVTYNSENLSLKPLVDSLNNYLLSAHAQDRRTVVMLDEAQNLSFEVLEQVRLLTNLETHKTKLLQIILVGQPELKDLLNRQDLRQLNQRITARYHLRPLSLNETREYIQHRLNVCGGDPKLFKAAAMRKIFQLSSGVPRLINLLCDRALLGTYTLGRKTVNASTVKKAATEVLPSQLKKHRVIGLTALCTTLIIVGLSIVYLLFAEPLKSYFNQNSIAAELVPATAEVELAKTEPVNIAEVLPMDTVIPENIQDDLQPSNETKVITEEVKKIANFSLELQNPELTISTAILQAIEIWGFQFPTSNNINCQLLQNFNFYCLYDKGTWAGLLDLNRPVILEFLLPSKQLRYGVLIGMDNGQPVIKFDEKNTYDLDEVLSYWNGHYLILWHSPKSKMVKISPKTSSAHVLWLREQLAAWDKLSPQTANPRYFDQALENRVKEFQRQHKLITDGVVGARTILHLQNSAKITNFPTLEITD